MLLDNLEKLLCHSNLSDPTFTRDAYGLMPPYAASLYGSDMAMHVERTVTVKAPDMSVVSAAEQKISQKLRQSFEADLSNRVGLFLAFLYL